MVTTDFRKVYNPSNSSDYRFIEKKGFVLLWDTIINNTTKIEFNYRFGNLKSKEMIEISYSTPNGGGRFLNINYCLPSETMYNRFLSILRQSKRYKYSKQQMIYEARSSSYSGEIIKPKGQVIMEGKIYFMVAYQNFEGKELSSITN